MVYYTIGIIGAMDEEIAHYLEDLNEKKEICYKSFTFFEGIFHGHHVVIVKSGVGKVFAAMTAQLLIDKFAVDALLFTGVAGSLNDSLDIGDVVVGNDSVHHDVDASALGCVRGQILFTDYRFFNAEQKFVKLALSTKLDGHKIIAGRICTGDQFFTHKEKNSHKYLYDELKGDCIEMEGAAVAQVATINEIPHVIIRTISDKGNSDAGVDFNKFMNIAAHNSYKIICHMVDNL